MAARVTVWFDGTSESVNRRVAAVQLRLSASPGGRWFLVAWPYLLLTAVAVFYVAASIVRHGPWLSVYDEATYLDALFTLPGNVIAQQGEPIGYEIREVYSCVGAMHYGPIGVPCGGDYGDLGAYPQQGLTSADGYTPLFFWITWVLAEGLALFGIWFVDAARLSMVVWLVPTVLLLFASLRRMRVTTAMALPLSMLFIASPFSWWTFTYVSTDAPAALIGALSLWIGLRFLLQRTGLWWLVPVAIIGQALKITTVLAPMLVGMMCLSVWIIELFRRRPHPVSEQTARSDATVGGSHPNPIRFRQWFWPIFVSGVGLVAVRFGWELIRQATALGPPAEQGVSVPYGTVGEAFYLVTDFLTRTVVSHPFRGSETYFLTNLYSATIGLLVAVGIMAAFFRAATSPTERGFTFAVAFASLTFAPLLFLTVSYLATPFALPARYGAALLPAFFVSLGLAPERPIARFAVATFAWLGSAYVILDGPTFM